ncbi:hypothetical protein [Rhodococcus sp. H29-C3]|uniref:hypothetical protein n=1 Tax=Rhodococcus sp. H29-C3 TaxID=3046307 RepID=UPI0024B9C67C|nr:hypothetical protein [Rhodococcus sp. H29-C3]MDJ0362327.1 hypothetical protein [Rhodococcus sp. H29-C3]
MFFRRCGRHPNDDVLHHHGRRDHHNTAPHNDDRLNDPFGAAVAINGHTGIDLHRARAGTGTARTSPSPGASTARTGTGTGTGACSSPARLVRELFGSQGRRSSSHL